MRNACQFSRRWHQQFCRSSNLAGHQQCLQTLQLARGYRQVTRVRPPPRAVSAPSQAHRDSRDLPRSSVSKSDSKLVVREFERDPDDESKIYPVEPNRELTEEMASTRRELIQLDRELATMRQGPFGPQSEFMQALPEDAREQLLLALEKEGILDGEQEDLLTMAELERLAAESEDEAALHQTTQRLAVTLRIPRKDQAYIRHFNQALTTASDAGDANVQAQLNLWRWYLRCQQQVHNFSTIISGEIWQFIWHSQAGLKVRPQHLVMLAKDMLEIKKTLQPDQWLAYIEALHANDSADEAIRVWQEQKAHLRTDPDLAGAFWELGVTLYAAVGQPAKAQELALNVLNNNIKAHPRILVPVIAAWAGMGEHDCLVKAWACYLRLKERADGSMLPDLYERITNAFLNTSHGDMALMVFKDMLLMNESSSHDSREVYKQAIHHFGEAQRNAVTEEQVNRIGLSALLVLPRHLQNRFFFTSWIKKLIGEQRIDSAVMVVELMYERGITPDAKPLNGIIGAWLREGTVSAQEKAESMAWGMIEARADFVSHRNAATGRTDRTFRKVIVDDNSQSVKRRVPSATIETFSILLQHYTRRQDTVQAERLTSAMVDSCEIQPNSYIMNHWLFADLHQGRLRNVWDKYRDLKSHIAPDLETFAALWDTTKVHLSKTGFDRDRHFPSAREVFAEMRDWVLSLSPGKAARAGDEFSAELYEQIVRCFCMSTDLSGTLLALHHLARMFGFYPTDNAVRLLCGQAVRLLPQEGRSSVGLPRNRRRVPVQPAPGMVQVANIIETIETQKKMTLLERGADPEAVNDPDSSIAQEVRLAVLTEFACMFMQRTQARTGSYRNDVKIAAETMHVDTDGIDLSLPESE